MGQIMRFFGCYKPVAPTGQSVGPLGVFRPVPGLCELGVFCFRFNFVILH